jgi:DNA-binding transcriptional MerR regulator
VPNRPESARPYTASDVRELTDLTYRQLNVWAGRGALPGDEGRGDGWRRFSHAELFVLALQVEIRRRFGVPVGRLRALREALLAGDADPLDEAARLRAETGGGVWLVTDLEDTTALLPDAEVGDFVAQAIRAGDAPAAFLWLKVGPIAERLATRLRQDTIPAGVRALIDTRDDPSPPTPEEAEVLRLIRSGDYHTIEVVMHDGAINTLRATQRRGQLKPEEVADLVRDHEYQKVTLTTKAGRIVDVEQRVTHKVRA